MIKRKTLIGAVTFLIISTMLNSCFLWHDKNRADRGRRFPHDDQKGQKQKTK
ncbi:hypothetical protein MUGA111182_14950 [Mucilaginibacter galii]|uniref:hypothetical protein n=1 Tax=Mucilaginibacter galii TaxID=2005073 RepID=UPI00166E04F0|nr:hypothetical protein [Mucilaginibacter galii]